MGFWEKIKAPTSLRLWPAGQPESVHSWRLNCCRPPEGRHRGGRPPAKHSLHGHCRPECCRGLPQRKLEKTPHLCDRRGQLLWEQPDRGNWESSNPSKTWLLLPKLTEPSSFLAFVLPCALNRLLLFFLLSASRTIDSQPFFLTLKTLLN